MNGRQQQQQHRVPKKKRVDCRNVLVKKYDFLNKQKKEEVKSMF